MNNHSRFFDFVYQRGHLIQFSGIQSNRCHSCTSLASRIFTHFIIHTIKVLHHLNVKPSSERDSINSAYPSLFLSAPEISLSVICIFFFIFIWYKCFASSASSGEKSEYSFKYSSNSSNGPSSRQINSPPFCSNSSMLSSNINRPSESSQNAVVAAGITTPSISKSRYCNASLSASCLIRSVHPKTIHSAVSSVGGFLLNSPSSSSSLL